MEGMHPRVVRQVELLRCIALLTLPRHDLDNNYSSSSLKYDDVNSLERLSAFVDTIVLLNGRSLVGSWERALAK